MNFSSENAQNAIFHVLDTISLDKTGAEAILKQDSLTIMLNPATEDLRPYKIAQQVLTSGGIPLQGPALLHLREAIRTTGADFEQVSPELRINKLRMLEQLLHHMGPVRHINPLHQES